MVICVNFQSRMPKEVMGDKEMEEQEEEEEDLAASPEEEEGKEESQA